MNDQLLCWANEVVLKYSDHISLNIERYSDQLGIFLPF